MPSEKCKTKRTQDFFEKDLFETSNIIKEPQTGRPVAPNG